MTDEEKVEEYAEGRAHEHYHFLFEENNGSPIDFAKLCYLDGLVEGRTEQRRLQIAYSDVLEKENAELKAQIEKMKLENVDLKNFLKNNLIQNTNNFLQSLSN